MRADKRSESGFTLIEVMVVVVILGILAALVVPKIMGRPDEARVIKARQDIQAVEAALNLYRLDNHVYPGTDQGLKALVEKPSVSRRHPTGRPAGIWTACRRTRGVATTST